MGKKASFESDYFAVGITLLELIVGANPIPGKTVSEIFDYLRNWQQPDLEKLDTSRELSKIIESLLDRDASYREMPSLA